MKSLFSAITTPAFVTLLALFHASEAVSAQPKVQLNHVFQVIDWETINAIRNNAFLTGQFAVTKTMVSGTDEQKWKATYMFGKTTYLEFFDPDGLKQNNPHFKGKSALALSTEKTGDLESLKSDFSSVLENRYRWEDFTLTTTTAATDDAGKIIKNDDGTTKMKTYDWFRWIKSFGPLNREQDPPFFTSWVMEYNPVFVNETKSTLMYPRVPSTEKPTDISREKYNKFLGYDPEKYFEDITEVDFVLGPDESVMIDGVLKKSGFALNADPARNQIIYSTSDMKITVIHAKEAKASRLARVKMSLNKSAQEHRAELANMSIVLGKARFDIDSEARTAKFTFTGGNPRKSP